MAAVRQKITVKVKPGSKKGPLVEQAAEGSFVVYVREPAIEGKANDAAIKLLAKHFNVPKSRIRLTSGQKSKVKLFQIETRQE